MRSIENYILLIRVLREDKKLLKWFLTLSEFPEYRRCSKLDSMINKMKKANEEQEMIDFVKSLKNKDIYRAVLNTLQHSMQQ